MIYVTVVFTVIFLFFIEIFTVLFQLTGLSKQKARFQVISILTGTGYTTKESELVTSSRIRRNIAQAIMIFGFISSATIVTLLFSFINSFKGFTHRELVFIFGAFLVVYSLIVISKAGKILDRAIEKIATRALFGKNTNVIVTKDSYDNDVVIAEIVIKFMPKQLMGKRLEDASLTRQGIMLLAIERENQIITQITKDTVLEVNDTITVFGPLYNINHVFYRSIKEQ